MKISETIKYTEILKQSLLRDPAPAVEHETPSQYLARLYREDPDNVIFKPFPHGDPDGDIN